MPLLRVSGMPGGGGPGQFEHRDGPVPVCDRDSDSDPVPGAFKSTVAESVTRGGRPG
jgi:hypothetical protein